MKYNILSKLTRVALSAALLALIPASAWAYETVTDSQTITGDKTLDAYQIGTKEQAGYLKISGGTVTFNSDVSDSANPEIKIETFRPATVYTDKEGKNAFTAYQFAGLEIVNGTVEISNATVSTEGTINFYKKNDTSYTADSNQSGVYLNAPSGCSANLILNSGANLTSNGYPTIGAELGTSGSLTVNDGATFTAKSALYVGGYGHGVVTLNKGGTINLVGSGLQIGRDYEPGKGDCEGIMNMNGGTLTVGKYLIMGRINPTDTHVNTAVMNITGGKATVAQYTCVGANTNGVPHERINAVLNIGGGEDTATMWVTGNFQVGCGENGATWDKPSDGTLNVYQNGVLKTGVDVATGTTAQTSTFCVGSTSSLNMMGGQLTVCGTGGLLNEGTINVKSGTLTVDKAVSNKIAGADINVAGGTFNAASVANAGTITIAPSLNGWGKMAITGAYSGAGTISVGLDHGLGLFSTLCNTVNEVLTAASGLTNVKYNSNLFTVTKTDTSIKAQTNTTGASTLKQGDSLTVNLAAGIAQLTGFEGNSAITFDVKNNGIALTDTETANLVDWLADSDALGDDLEVSGANSQITLSGLHGIKDGSYVAFDLGSYNTNYTVGTVGSYATPEPATWALMLLGLGALATVRRKH